MGKEDTSLKNRRPDIFVQINHELTAEHCPEVDLETISYGSNKKLWWNCNKDSQHVWDSAIKSRTAQGSGCLYCAGHRVMTGNNDLEFLNPEVASQWHPTKNGDLLPSQFSVASTKKVWWLCADDSRHEWETTIKTRNRGRGCPVCINYKIVKGINDFATYHPELVSEWVDELNYPLTPYNVAPSANKTVWWKCAKDDRHIYQASINEKDNHKTGCSVCAGRTIIQGVNDAATRFPELIKQWHPTLNGELKFSEVAPTSHKSAWWICKIDPAHEWETKISSRTVQGSSCPECSFWKTEHEFREIFKEKTGLKFVSGSVPVKWNIRNSTQIDILNEEQKLCIEYDGLWSHGGLWFSPRSEEESLDRDVRKTKALLSAGYTVIRIRADGLLTVPVSDKRFFQTSFKEMEDKNPIVERCIEFCHPFIASK